MLKVVLSDGEVFLFFHLILIILFLIIIHSLFFNVVLSRFAS